MRRALAVLGIALALAGSGLAQPTPAGAHDYYESGNIRIHGCALSQKYGCQAHYLRRWNGGAYGILYETRHSHACTDRGGDAAWWKLGNLEIRNQGNIDWSMLSHNHEHTTEWCGQAVSVHMWYPNNNVASGNNRWYVRTQQLFDYAYPTNDVLQECAHQFSNFSGTTSVSNGGTPVSPAGGNC